MIQKSVGGDIAEIETVMPYTGSYEDIVKQGQEEVDSGFMPEIKPLSVNTDDYDKIILGTPTWWYTMAPAMKSFLNRNNLSGKTTLLFQTHGGWQGHVFEDMKAMIQGNITGEFAVQFDSSGGDELITSISEIEQWIESVTNATILPGVTVGKYAIIGAASVVTHNVPDYGVVVGNPAKVIKTLDASKFE